jgi:phospholipid/cholesterol/gamma-HCH transport system substrate-binding protein
MALTQNKARWAQLRVGVMAAVALVIAGALIFLLTGNSNPFAKKVPLYTFIEDAAALTEGAPVHLNGIVVGKVSKIALSGLPDLKRTIKLDLEVEDQFLAAIPVDSIAGISQANVLGTQFINIKKGRSPVPIKAGQELTSKDVSDFNDVIEQGSTLLVQLQAILKRVDAIVGQVELGKGSIGKLLVDEELYNRLLGIVAEGQKLASTLNTDKGTLGKLIHDPTLYNDFRASLARVDSIIEGLQRGEGSAGKLLKDPKLYDDAHRTITELRTMLGDINAGKGSVGKFLKSDDLHNQISSIISKFDVMVDKINSGQGTIGQLMVNTQLYDSLNGATRELHEFMKDFRKDPKKFLRIKLSLF